MKCDSDDVLNRERETKCENVFYICLLESNKI